MSNDTEAEYGGLPEVAVIGMAGRFPGADDLETFWSNLRQGVDSITYFSDEELLEAGLPPELVAHPDYVKASGKLRDVETFDAGFFGYSPREAEVLEPAHRIFLECCWEALESAGYDPERVDGPVGVFAGAGTSHYVEHRVKANPDVVAAVGEFQLMVGSGKDFIATRTAYKMNLKGPAVSVQSACSTGLVCVHVAAQALLRGECDMAMAGGTSVVVPQQTGYLYTHGGIMSPDGKCRAFDAKSAGAQAGSGVGVVVLKRLDDALADGDTIHAVIKGSAVNNDGALKVAFTAPSVDGQAAVIAEALAAADVHPDTIAYVEAHGTGTELGDPIEIAALTKAYRAHTDRTQFCTVGSVKTNIGHLDTAAGTAGFIKAVLALKGREIPPTVHFESPNPKIDFASSPFLVSGEGRPWESEGPRRAGVSSFGIGGTNAHVILEEAPEAEPGDEAGPWQLLPLSARSAGALDAATARLAAHLRAHPEQALADAAWTLQAGRRTFSHRRMVVVHAGEDVAAVLEARTPDRVVSGAVEAGHRSVAFMFPGLGDQYPNMARGLYEHEPVFRAELDRCAQILKPHLGGLDLREVLFPGDAPEEPGAPGAAKLDLRRMLGRDAGPDAAAERLNRTEVAQPAVFAVEWALAQLWISKGIRPEAVIGHSLGEYAAATVAGVFPLEEALALVAERARMIQALPGGAMLAVSLSAEGVKPFLAADLAIATVNAPELCVVSGPTEAVAALEERLAAAGHVARRLPTTHAFHSPMMEPIVERFRARVASMRLSAPKVRFASNLTGTWITAEQAVDPEYWARHLRETVRFDEGVAELLKEPGRVLLEVGPGQTLSTFVRQRPAAEGEAEPAVVPSVRYPYDRTSDRAFLLGALGRLWVAGLAPDWPAVHGGARRRRVPLPTYPWERQRYWVEAPTHEQQQGAAPQPQGKRPDAADWIWLPSWKGTAAPAPAAEPAGRWLVLADGGPVGEGFVAGLRARGRDAVVVRPGDAFARVADDEFTVRGDHRTDWRELLDALGEEDRAPAAAAHLWALGEDEDQASGYSSFLLMIDALGRDRATVMPVLAVTRGVHDVTGAEEIVPAKATLTAAAQVATQEHPNLRCRSVDVVVPARPADAALLAAQLVDEAESAAAEPVVALRGRRRWTQTFDAVRPRGDGAARLRPGGAYLLTDGANGRTLTLARHLVETVGARLAIVDPRLPGRGGWDAWVAARPVEDEVRRSIEWIRDVESRGAEVLVLTTPLGRAEQVAGALREVEERFGAVHGVIHTPGLGEISDFAAITETKPEQWEMRLGRVAGELASLEEALEGRALDFVLVDSSVASVLGGVGIVRVAAADAMIDAFVRRHNATRETPWTSVVWDVWQPEGDGAEAGGMMMGAHLDLAIRGEEATRAFQAVLSFAGEANVVVSTAHLPARLDASRVAAKGPGEGGAAGYARPDLGNEYFPPTNDLEERICEMWQELLGINQIGIHDDFFALGGHSLLATQIISRVRETFQLELPLKAVFEAPTVSRFATLVEEAIIAELEDLSEEEAMELL